MSHRGRTHLDVAGAQQQKFSGVPPIADAADRRNRQTLTVRIASKIGHHVKRDGLDRGPTVTAVSAHGINRWINAERIQIHRHHGVNGVDQRDRVCTPFFCRPGRLPDIGNIWGELHYDRES